MLGDFPKVSRTGAMILDCAVYVSLCWPAFVSAYTAVSTSPGVLLDCAAYVSLCWPAFVSAYTAVSTSPGVLRPLNQYGHIRATLLL